MGNMTQHIRESNLIEGIDDKQADKDCMGAWEWLLEQENIGRAEILHLHKMITKHQTDLSPSEKGNYRYIQVWVGGYQPPNALRVPELMEGWIAGVFLKSPKQAHISFEKIHPFVDGNGRTGRMLMWWHELKRGETPTLLLNKNKQEYYKWFKVATPDTKYKRGK